MRVFGMNLRKQWFKEYSQKGIPSSYREQPSGAVVWFFEFLKKKELASGRVLDLGCGKGRNSIFFATNGFEVYAIDFVCELIEELNGIAKQNHLAINGICQSITDPFPFPDKYFDVVIDIFCYKHQTSKEKQAFYRKEVFRVLKDEGFYLLALAGDDDGYYGPLLKSSPEPENKMIIDSVINVGSYLYSREDIEKEFAHDFRIVTFQHKKKKGLMHGKEYLRSTLVFTMRKVLK